MQESSHASLYCLEIHSLTLNPVQFVALYGTLFLSEIRDFIENHEIADPPTVAGPPLRYFCKILESQSSGI